VMRSHARLQPTGVVAAPSMWSGVVLRIQPRPVLDAEDYDGVDRVQRQTGRHLCWNGFGNVPGLMRLGVSGSCA
jgi:hypothetical protein